MYHVSLDARFLRRWICLSGCILCTGFAAFAVRLQRQRVSGEAEVSGQELTCLLACSESRWRLAAGIACEEGWED
jgi:hypothetical protein